jgi:hypothetical protein
MSSLKENEPVCYSNACYHLEERDTFVDSQARMDTEFVQQLIHQQWIAAAKAAVRTTETPASMKMNMIKIKADNLLRLTKSRAIARLKSA